MTAAANIYATRITHDNTAVSERHGRVAEEIRESPGAAGLFTTLGVQPLLGRDFRPDDGRPGPPSVVMLDHGYWMRAHGGAADSVGPSISVDGARIEVAGVMPSGFRIVQDADMTTDDIKAPSTALTPLYVKTHIQAARVMSWRARKSVMTGW